MAGFNYPIELLASGGNRYESLRARVDAQCSYCVFPATILASLGIEPQWTDFFSAPDGSQQQLPMAEIGIRVDGRERTTICVFGSPASIPVLGAYALAGLAMEPDPENRSLKAAPLYLT